MSAGKKIGYIRVSTIDQNPDRQLEGMELDKRFIDYASGATPNRPQLSIMLDYCREADVVYVHSMDRLARSVRDLLDIVDHLIKRKVEIRFMAENLVFNGNDSPLSHFLLTTMGAYAELERKISLERQREGIKIAKAKGIYGGSKSPFTPELGEKIMADVRARDRMVDIAKKYRISRTSLYKYVKMMNEKERVIA